MTMEAYCVRIIKFHGVFILVSASSVNILSTMLPIGPNIWETFCVYVSPYILPGSSNLSLCRLSSTFSAPIS
jgi:hypothetical protein